MAGKNSLQRREETRGEHRSPAVAVPATLRRHSFGAPAAAEDGSPEVDIFEEDERLLIVADTPGVEAKDLELGVEEGTLVIKAARRAPDAEKKCLYHEFAPVGYYRAFSLSEAVAAEKIEASMKDGVLTVVLPKIERLKTRKIDVRGE